MDSDPSEKDTDAGKQASRVEHPSPLEAPIASQTDQLDDSVAAGKQPGENQPAANDANVDAGLDERESMTADALPTVDHSPAPPTTSSVVNSGDSPAAANLVASAGDLPSEPEHVHTTGDATPQLSDFPELAPPQPERVSLEDMEQPAALTAVAPSQFEDSDESSLRPVAEVPVNLAQDKSGATTIQSPAPAEGMTSLSHTDGNFSGTLEAFSPPTFRSTSGSPDPAQSASSAEADIAFVETAAAPVTGQSWQSTEPAISPSPSGSQDETADFRMPPLLLEVSFAETQNFREDFLDYFVPLAQKLIRECIASEFSERDFMQAAELRAVYGR